MKHDVRDRLETVDRRGHRLWVYSDIVNGIWRKRRANIAYILIVVYLLLPWLRWNQLQLIQFDLIKSKLIFFGVILDFSESSVLLMFLLGFGFLILSCTSLAGRVWCGWSCPQTVFLDYIFRPIEKWIEGRPLERRQRDQSGLTFNKFIKKSTKWFLYGITSFIIANTFVAYFSGSESLLKIMQSSPSSNPFLFGVMILIFSGFLFNFGWFREQMCTLVCPYGRLQSVIMDKNSFIISYDSLRGETRGKGKGGDCVDCKRCVQVCPTGIDIRNGLQLECISCAACIDACNVVMSKVNKPKDLIKYTTENKINKKEKSAYSYLRPLAYLLISLSFFCYSIRNAYFRDQFKVMELKSQALPIPSDSDQIRNQLGFLITNQSSEELSIHIEVPGEVILFIGQNPVIVPSGESKSIQLFIQAPKALFVNGIAKSRLTFFSESEKIEVRIVLLNQGGSK